MIDIAADSIAALDQVGSDYSQSAEDSLGLSSGVLPSADVAAESAIECGQALSDFLGSTGDYQDLNSVAVWSAGPAGEPYVGKDAIACCSR